VIGNPTRSCLKMSRLAVRLRSSEPSRLGRLQMLLVMSMTRNTMSGAEATKKILPPRETFKKAPKSQTDRRGVPNTEMVSAPGRDEKSMATFPFTKVPSRS